MMSVNPALLLQSARRRSALSAREAASRARTSHATLLAYESGRVQPGPSTLRRLLSSSGFALEATLVHEPSDHHRGEELVDVLLLAEQFPVRHDQTLRCPVFGR